MMTETESLDLAHELLTAAGWRPLAKAPWNGRCAVPGLVGGISPSGDQYAKAYTAFPQAHAPALGLDPADYPDEAHEAAAVLIRQVAPGSKSGQDTGHETDSEIVPEGRASDIGGGEGDAATASAGYDPGAAGAGLGDGYGEAKSAPDDAAFIEIAAEGADLDPLALPEPDPADFDPDEIDLGAEILEDGPSFIFGPPADDTEALRSQRIGDVVRIALERMPTITPEDDAALMELRNFAMGVSEGRWPNDADKQAALEALEAVVSLQRLVEAERDARVAFLVTADRPALDAFKAEEGWP